MTRTRYTLRKNSSKNIKIPKMWCYPCQNANMITSAQISGSDSVKLLPEFSGREEKK